MTNRGFTLIEIMVAMSIFAIVAVITTGALVTVSDVNRKAQAIKIAIDNVTFAMDSMLFNLRDGSRFGCVGDPSLLTISDTANLDIACTPGGRGIMFISRRTTSAGGGGAPPIIIYRFNEDASQHGSIQVASTASPEYKDITSSEVDIESLKFYIPSTGYEQRVTMVVKGQVPGKNPTNFNLQTSVKASF